MHQVIENTISHNENNNLVCHNDLFLLDKHLTFEEDVNVPHCLSYYIGIHKGGPLNSKVIIGGKFITWIVRLFDILSNKVITCMRGLPGSR